MTQHEDALARASEWFTEGPEWVKQDIRIRKSVGAQLEGAATELQIPVQVLVPLLMEWAINERRRLEEAIGEAEIERLMEQAADDNPDEAAEWAALDDEEREERYAGEAVEWALRRGGLDAIREQVE
jgi:hypothetical protein